MKLLFRFILCCLFLISLPSAHAAEWGGVTDALKEGKAQAKPIILKFESDNCGACDKLNEFTLSDPGVKALLVHFATAKIDVYDTDSIATYQGSAYTYRELTQHFNIKARPTSLFLTPDGVVIDAVKGYIPKQTYIQILNTILNDYTVE